MLVIFDCDGVLLDSERILNQVFRECLAKVGLELSLEETICRFKGRATRDCLVIAEQLLGRPIPFDVLTLEYERLGTKRFQEEISPIPGISEALAKIRTRRCVASSSSHDHIRTGLELTGLIRHFDSIFSASEVERGKPAPDIFLHAAEKMEADPGNCIVIEDSPAGVEAAVAAGMSVLGYVDLTPAHELEEAGARTFDNMLNLPDLIENL